MKCPKCGYVGFESADKCRNCGYHFSLADAPVELDLSVDPDPGQPLGAPDDLDLRLPAPTPPVGSVRGAQPRRQAPPTPVVLPANDAGGGVEDLPLFGGEPAGSRSGDTPDAGRVADGPRRQIAAAMPSGDKRAPLPPPAAARMRPRADAQYRPTALALESDTPADAVPLRRRGAASGPRQAGPVARAIAAVLDGLILGGLDLGVLYFTLRVCRLSFAQIAQLPPAPLVGFFLLLDGAYLVAFTAHGGQTIGKMATGIRVVGDDGTPVIASQSMVRAAGYLASILPAGLGFVPGLFGPARRALHDRLANTRVIKA
ncbi:MAG: RDD family protein [Bacteroidales bacterium]